MSEPRRKWADWMRSRFNDRERFLLACVVCGLLCGLLAVVFHLSIHHTFHHLWEFATTQNGGETETWKLIAVMLTAPTVGGLICGLAIRFWVPGAVGSGIPQTKEAYYNKGGRIRTLTGFWRVILGTLYVGLGNALGREGPMVHASSAIASRIGRFIFKDPERVRAMIPVGMAAGIGAAFNAPLSAITFVFEELLDNFSTKAIGGMVVAVVIAAAVSRSILGEDPVISTHLSLDYETAAWMLVALPLGLLAGGFGHFFVGAVIGGRRWVRSKIWLRSWYAPAIGGLLCGVIGLVAWWSTGLAGNAQHGVFSIGYESLEAAFENQLIMGVLAALLVFKLIAVVVNYSTGGSGGLFSPTLFLGGMLGGIVGIGLVEFNHWVEILEIADESQIIGGCVLLGMGAMFGSVIRCPFTSLIIIFEMTGNYSLILPLMGGNMLSWAIARKLRPIPIYDALLLDDGVSLKRMPSYRGAQDYRNLPVRSIMTHDVVSALAWESAEDNLQRFGRSRSYHHAFTVVDEDDRFVGVVTLHEIKGCDPDTLVASIVAEQDVIHVHPEVSIRDASRLMIKHDIQQLPVVSRSDPHRLLGILTLNDIARQQNASEI
ncbi:MAG: chloride channel protein [Verrucomicrobiae bacterium]|nr:chloride channel protein [Verrucomicrobiae bacterium]NNJ44261.1 chloride channel protein [Akkermansiaceae bacterium]